MTVAAPPHPPEPADTRPDDVVEALIEEARQRARRRRWTYGAMAVVVMFTAVAAIAAFDGSDSTQGEGSGLDLAGGAAADVGGTGELVASLYVHHWAGVGPDHWVYVYADGRMISTNGNGWYERRLTPDGVEFVRAHIVSSGLFDPDEPAPVGRGDSAQIQVRNGDRLVYLPRTLGEEWTADYDRLIARLRNLPDWLPAAAWADSEPKVFVPARYAACVEPSTVALLPAAASALLTTASLVPWEDIREIDPAADQRRANDGLCYDVTSEQAQRLLESLGTNAQLAPNPKSALFVEVDVPGSERIGMLFKPFLPHGAPECACYG